MGTRIVASHVLYLVPDVRTQTINHITRLRTTAIIVRLTKLAHPISRHLYFIGAPTIENGGERGRRFLP
jgi:hypothetical protein